MQCDYHKQQKAHQHSQVQGRNVLFLLLEGWLGEEFNSLSAAHCSHQRGKGAWVRNLQPMGFPLILLLAPVVRSNKWKCAMRNWYDCLFLLCKLPMCGRGNPMVLCVVGRPSWEKDAISMPTATLQWKQPRGRILLRAHGTSSKEPVAVVAGGHCWNIVRTQPQRAVQKSWGSSISYTGPDQGQGSQKSCLTKACRTSTMSAPIICKDAGQLSESG